ncbi:hypothetical protein NMD64_13430 [Edwardsiella tarda]|uniref:hypothetical protein n=1 Tax=Edwardsiella tarda TaxID=636 RepID=UPI00351CB522
MPETHIKGNGVMMRFFSEKIKKEAVYLGIKNGKTKQSARMGVKIKIATNKTKMR